MRFFHLADLHFGKQLHGLSLIAEGDQGAWVDGFLALARRERPDAVLISGDVYDRSVPPREAVELFDRFLTELCGMEIPVLLIAGNHDSGPRLNFASELLKKQNVHISGMLGPELRTVVLRDAHGPVRFWLMPYLFPAAVEEALGVTGLHTYDAAARALIGRQETDPAERNVLIAHQLVLSGKSMPEEGGSETMVGGVGQIDVSAFDGFDYVALGHIHKPQAIGREGVRYAGSPMCYHFSEIGWKKGALMVEMGKKGEVSAQMMEIAPKHPLREIRGEMSRIIEEESVDGRTGEYIRVVLTDEQTPPAAFDTLDALFRAKGSRLLDLAREERRFAPGAGAGRAARQAEKTVEELFTAYYGARMNGAIPDDKEEKLIGFAASQVMHAPEDAGEQEWESLADKLVAFALEQEGKE